MPRPKHKPLEIERCKYCGSNPKIYDGFAICSNGKCTMRTELTFNGGLKEAIEWWNRMNE